MSQLFADKFTRADDAASPGGVWSEWGGNWAILSNEVKWDTRTGLCDVVNIPTSYISTADYSVQARCRHPTGQVDTDFFGVCGRRINSGAGNSNGYFVMLSKSNVQVRLYSRLTTTWTLIASAAFTVVADVMYLVKLRMQGTTIKAFVNGVEYISVVNTAFADAGDAGLVVSSGAVPAVGFFFDDFHTEDLLGYVVSRKDFPLFKLAEA